MSKSAQKLIEDVEKAIPEIENAVQGYSVLIVSEVEGALKSRIFNEGGDSKGKKIGKYKNGPYKKKREKAGRQTGYVDLQFQGNLNKSIVKGTKEGKLVVGFNDPEQAKIAEYQEEKRGIVIFSPSEKELRNAVETGEKYIMDRLEKIVQNIIS